MILRTYTIPSATYASGKGSIQIPGFTSVPSGYAVFGSHTDTGKSETMIANLNIASGSNAYLSYYSSAQVTTAIIVRLILIKIP